MHPYIGIVGLGYVGLPLAVCFGCKYPTIGFDINKERVKISKYNMIKQTIDEKEFEKSKFLSFTDDPSILRHCDTYIITVPTPIDNNKNPDLKNLMNASALVGSLLKRNDLVIFESTVYPGTTEDICLPILESKSGLKLNQDFHLGYSPERINPGDKKHKIDAIVKVTSGSNKSAADRVNSLYQDVIQAGTFRAASIKVAEAAKVIENTQRDLNIALMNELSKIFNLMDIDTNEV